MCRCEMSKCPKGHRSIRRGQYILGTSTAELTSVTLQKRPNQGCTVRHELSAHAAHALYVYVSWSKGHCDHVEYISYQEIQRILHRFISVCAGDGTHGVGRRTSGSTAPELLGQGSEGRRDEVVVVENGPDS